MAVTILPSLGQVRRYAGYSGDKPTTAVVGSEFYEFETGLIYVWDGAHWNVEKTDQYFLRELRLYLDRQNLQMARMLEIMEALVQHLIT